MRPKCIAKNSRRASPPATPPSRLPHASLTPLDSRVWRATKEAAARLGRSPDTIVRDYVEAVEILAGTGSVLDAVRDWRRRHETNMPRASVAEVVEELLASLEAKRRAKCTVKSLRIPLKRLADHLQMPIADVRTSDLENWLSQYPQNAARTTNNWISSTVRLFNFAKGRYIPQDSPVADRLDAITDDRRAKPVAIFQPWELSKLLAHSPAHPQYLIALGAFAGLRTIELHRLDWSAIHFEPTPAYPHGFIDVASSVAKQHRTASRRIIPMQPNLVTWLEPGRLLHGRISDYHADGALSAAITDVINQINAEQEKRGFPLLSRPENGARHSYGSYRLPVLENVAALALEMNNSPAQIIRNYREVVHPARVPEYWAISRTDPKSVTIRDKFSRENMRMA